VAIADQALFNGDYNPALYQYQIVLTTSADPDIQSAALWGRARIEHALGNETGALDDLQRLTSGYPNSINAAHAYFLMGDVLNALQRHTDAVAAYDTYLSLRPGAIDYYVHVRRGDAYAAAGNYEAAITAYKAALSAPHIGDDTALQVRLAQAYVSKGDTTTALTMYDSIATASSNDYVKAQMDLLSGQVYLSLGQADQAYQRFLHTVENYPLAYDSYSALVALVNAGVPVDELERGLVDYFAAQYGYAMDAFVRYANANPQNDGTVFYYIAKTHLKLGNYQQAVDAYSNFISNYSTNRYWQTAWDEKADIQWADLGQYDAAAQTLLDYIKADQGNSYIPQAMLTVGRIYERAGRTDDAARTWDGIADAYPGNELSPQALFLAGIVRYRTGNYSQALVTFQRDLILSTVADDQARAYFWIGKTQQKMGASKEAQSAWQLAAGLDQTGYYSIRASDMLFNRAAFTPPSTLNTAVDLNAERAEAEVWVRVTFNLPADTDLSKPGSLESDPRLIRGTELWRLGLKDIARSEFEDLRNSIENDAGACYRLTNYLLDLGLYRTAIFTARQVLTLAGQQTQSQTLAAPRYFNRIRYGMYYPDLIDAAALQYSFDPLLVYSVVRQESLFEGFVSSTAGARGLMQIIPDTGQFLASNLGWPPDYSAEDLYRPVVNVKLGTYFLAWNRLNVGNNPYEILAAYNAGPESAKIWQGISGDDPDLFLEVIRYSETGDYIRSIYEIYNMYRLLYGAQP
jgi:soluble lytic murein transglycosylase